VGLPELAVRTERERKTMLPDWTDLIRLIVSGLVGGIGGVVLSGWLAGKREQYQRRHAFVERQLRDLYSPLLGLRAEIRVRSEFRVKVHAVADRVWRGLVEEARQRGGPEATRQLGQAKSAEFDRIISYDNERLMEDLLPAYRQMVNLLRENMWLADGDTRQYFGALIEFIEIWDRWIAKALPAEVAEALDHSEETLHPFYDHLARRHDELRDKLAGGET
jgi:hypothetical protein